MSRIRNTGEGQAVLSDPAAFASSGPAASSEPCGPSASSRRPSGSRVMVALNRAAGLVFALPDGRRVRLEGNAAPLRGKEKGVLPVGAFGLTEVAADDWDWIVKTYGSHLPLFKSGLLFARTKREDAEACAAERRSLRHGLEPVDVRQTPRTEPFDGRS